MTMAIGRIFGRRGITLLVYAALWILMGLSRKTGGSPIDGNNHDESLWFHLFFSDAQRGNVWIITGVTAGLIAVFLRRSIWQVFGFFVLVLLPLLNSTSFAWSGIAFLIPGGPDGAESSIYASLLWIAITLKVFIDAGWDEDIPPKDPTTTAS